MFKHSDKVYYFRTPSNQEIKLDCLYIYKDIVTVNDLKYLFTMKLRLYTMDMFDLARITNIKTNEMEILDVNTNLSDLQDILEYQVIHKEFVVSKQNDIIIKELTQTDNKIIESNQQDQSDISKSNKQDDKKSSCSMA